MNWHYVDGDAQVGPVEQEALVSLIRSGTVKSTTPVWRDGMADWQVVGQTELASLLPRNAPPPFTGTTTPPPNPRVVGADPGSASFKRDSKKIYPSDPPTSPHLCWFGLLIIGLPQMIYGQIGKGILWLMATGAIQLPFGLWYCFAIKASRWEQDVPNWPAYLPIMISIALNICDAYKVGSVLQSGRPVGKWTFFPN